MRGEQVFHLPRDVRDEFGRRDFGERPVILPVQPLRVRSADLLRRFSLLSGQVGFILPVSKFTPPGSHAVFGLRRASSGTLEVLWSGSVQLP